MPLLKHQVVEVLVTNSTPLMLITHCPKCKFPMSFDSFDAASTCPLCGADLAKWSRLSGYKMFLCAFGAVDVLFFLFYWRTKGQIPDGGAANLRYLLTFLVWQPVL